MNKNCVDTYGLEEGLEKGIEQGIEQATLAIACSLLNMMDDKAIASSTGLSIEKIKRLRKSEE